MINAPQHFHTVIHFLLLKLFLSLIAMMAHSLHSSPKSMTIPSLSTHLPLKCECSTFLF